jgi:pSer/pThr/pTyr-binding forkhead associated (FHA) protein
VVIGRAPDCDVVIKDNKASRRHCKLTRQDDGFLLEDLGSRNGTFVDGAKINEPISLKTNHTFKIGDTIFYLA